MALRQSSVKQAVRAGKRYYRKNRKNKWKLVFGLLLAIALCVGVLYGLPKIPTETLQELPVLQEIKNYFYKVDPVPFAPTDIGALEKYELEDGRVLYGPFRFERVTDGDTLHVTNPSGTDITIRLIGIDTPESVHPDAEKNTELGKKASDWLKNQFETEFPHTLYLEYDVTPIDKYGRTLAYLYFDQEGEWMLNKTIIESGYAVPMTIQPNSTYADGFVEAYEYAVYHDQGLWKEIEFSKGD